MWIFCLLEIKKLVFEKSQNEVRGKSLSEIK